MKTVATHCNARINIDAWWEENTNKGLDPLTITASGGDTMLKDYGYMQRNDAEHAKKADKISGLTNDITDFFK